MFIKLFKHGVEEQGGMQRQGVLSVGRFQYVSFSVSLHACTLSSSITSLKILTKQRKKLYRFL